MLPLVSLLLLLLLVSPSSTQTLISPSPLTYNDAPLFSTNTALNTIYTVDASWTQPAPPELGIDPALFFNFTTASDRLLQPVWLRVKADASLSSTPCAQLEVSVSSVSSIASEVGVVLKSSVASSALLTSRSDVALNVANTTAVLRYGLQAGHEYFLALGSTNPSLGTSADVTLRVSLSSTPSECYALSTLSRYEPGASYFSADMDGDLDLDLVVADGGNRLVWHENLDGHGTLSSSRFIETEAHGSSQVFCADLDGDGDNDCVTSSYHITIVAWYENVEGDGSTWKRHLLNERMSSSYGVLISDLDHDGLYDVVASYGYDPGLHAWFNNDGRGSFGDEVGVYGVESYFTSYSFIVAADIDGDSLDDLVAVISQSNQGDGIAWFRNHGNRTFSDAIVIELFSNSEHVTAGDLDGDGTQDVVACSSSLVRVYLNQGDMTFSPITFATSASPLRAQAIDMNGDNTVDLLVALADKMVWLENTDGSGTSWTEHFLVSAPRALSVYATDLAGDGKLSVYADTEDQVVLASVSQPLLRPHLDDSMVRIQELSASGAIFSVSPMRPVTVHWLTLPGTCSASAADVYSSPHRSGSMSRPVLPSWNRVVMQVSNLEPGTEYCLSVVASDGQVIGDPAHRQFTTLPAATDATLHGIVVNSGSPQLIPTGGSSTLVELSLTDSQVVITPLCASGASVLIADQHVLCQRPSAPIPTQARSVQLMVTVTAPDNVTSLAHELTLVRAQQLLYVDEVLFNPTRETNSLLVNRWSLSALKFIKLKRTALSASGVVGLPIVLDGSLQADLSSLVGGLDPDADLFVVKNKAAFLQTYNIPVEATVVQWDVGGDMWTDTAHDGVRLLVNGTVQWELAFDPDASWAAAVNGNGQSIATENRGYSFESTGAALSTLSRPDVLTGQSNRGFYAAVDRATSRPRALCMAQVPALCASSYEWDSSKRVPLPTQTLGSTSILDVWADSGSEGIFMRLADVNNDGVDDVVVYRSIDSVRVLEWYAAHPTAAGFDDPVEISLEPGSAILYLMGVHDVSGDGAADVLYTSWYPSQLVLLTNSGDGRSFVSSVLMETAPDASFAAFALADWLGDGSTSVMALSRFPTNLYLLHNSTSGWTSRVVISDIPNSPSVLHAARFDSNSTRVDVVICDYQGVTVAVNVHGNASVWQEQRMGSRCSAVAVADMSMDGVNDLVVAGDDELLLYETAVSSGATTFTLRSSPIAATSDTVELIVVADVTGDGRPDVVYFGSAVEVAESEGIDAWKRRTLLDAYLYEASIVISPVSAHRRAELVFYDDGLLLSTVAEPGLGFASAVAGEPAVADFDGDGLDDFLVDSYFELCGGLFFGAADAEALELSCGVFDEAFSASGLFAGQFVGPPASPLDVLAVNGTSFVVYENYGNASFAVSRSAAVQLSDLDSTRAIMEHVSSVDLPGDYDGVVYVPAVNTSQVRMAVANGTGFAESVLYASGGAAVTAITRAPPCCSELDYSAPLGLLVAVSGSSVVTWIVVDADTFAVSTVSVLDVSAGLSTSVATGLRGFEILEVGYLTADGTSLDLLARSQSYNEPVLLRGLSPIVGSVGFAEELSYYFRGDTLRLVHIDEDERLDMIGDFESLIVSPSGLRGQGLQLRADFVAAAHVDSDSIADLITVADNAVSFHLNHGDRTFQTHQVGTTASNAVAPPVFVDVFGSDDADIVVFSGDTSSQAHVTVFERVGPLAFIPRTIPIESLTGGAVTGVVSRGLGDSGDVVMALGRTNVVLLSRANRSAPFEETLLPLSQHFGARVSAPLVSADVVPGGFHELVCAFRSNEGPHIGLFRFERLLNGTLASQLVVAAEPGHLPSQVYEVVFVLPFDVDGSGSLDLLAIVEFSSSATVVWLPNVDGAGAFAAAVLLDEAQGTSYQLSVQQLLGMNLTVERDRTDVVGVGRSLVVFESIGSGLSSARELGATEGCYAITSLGSADLDADGDDDIFYVDECVGGGSVAMFENRATRDPDSSSSMTCELELVSLFEGSGSRTVECFISARHKGEPVSTSSSSFILTTSGVNVEQVSVSVPEPDFGSEFTFRVSSSVRAAVTLGNSLTASWTLEFTYPPPVMEPHSLVLLEGSGASSNGAVVLSTTSSVRLRLGVSNVGTSTQDVLVTYGPMATVDSFVCTVVRLEGQSLECLTQGQERLASLVPLVLSVTVGDQTAEPEPTNTLELVPAPQVLSVRGCDHYDEETGVTSGCPLEGGIVVNVTGIRLGVNGTTNILAGSRLCQTVEVRPPSSLTCLLPASDGGTALVTPLTIKSSVDDSRNVAYGAPRPLISYRIAEIVGLYGCDTASSSVLHLRGCSRDSEERITIYVVNLGSVASGVRISVGGAPCFDAVDLPVQLDLPPAVENATASLTSKVSGISCTLSGGTLPNQGVVALDGTGRPSVTQALVSYLQCLPGSAGAATGADVSCKLCAPGRFAGREGLTECLPCDPGKFMNDSGAQRCLDCAAGSVATGFAAERCELCEEGLFQLNSGESSCDNCAPGRFSDERGTAGLCARCPDGFVAPSQASSRCTACGRGRYQAPGFVECVLCEPGRASNVTGVNDCVSCEPGHFAAAPGSRHCERCPTGKFQAVPGQSGCLDCTPGRFAGVSGSLSCNECPRNTFSAGPSSSRCTVCDPLEYTAAGTPGEGNTRCDKCPPNEYVVFAAGAGAGDPNRVKDECASCPPGASCDGEAVFPGDGVWAVRQSDGSRVESYRCLPLRCEECAVDGPEGNSSVVSCCSSNRKPAEENPMCAQCASGFVEWGGECIECDKTNYALLGGLLAGLGACILFMHVVLNQQSNPLAPIFFYYVQMALLMFGEETEWLAWLSFFNFNPIQNASGGQCVAPWSPVTKMVIGVLSPALSWAFLAVICVVHAAINVCASGSVHGRKSMAEWLVPYKRSCLAFFMFTFNNVATTSLRFFGCQEVAGGQWRVVRASPDIDCDSDEYERAQPLFFGCLCVVVVSPMLLLAWLRLPGTQQLAEHHRATLRNGGIVAEQASRLELKRRSWGILFEVFRGDGHSVPYHWNVVILVRRALVILVTVLALPYNRTTQYSAITTAHVLVLVVHTYYQPFRDMTVEGVFVQDAAHRRALRLAGKTILPINHLETVSLLALTLMSTALTAMDIPLNDTQKVAFSVVVFGWMGVLQLCIVARVHARRTAMRKKATTAKAHHTRDRSLPMSASASGPFGTGGLPDDAAAGEEPAGGESTLELARGRFDSGRVVVEEETVEVVARGPIVDEPSELSYASAPNSRGMLKLSWSRSRGLRDA